MSYEELLKEFASKLGDGIELAPDVSGAVVLDVDGMQLTIIGFEELEQVVISGIVGEPPPEDHLERLYRSILEANFNFAGTFGATLSVNPDDGVVTLCRVLPLALADGDSFFVDVEHFVNVLETWRKLVADFRSSADAPEAEDVQPEESPASGGFDGFLQV